VFDGLVKGALAQHPEHRSSLALLRRALLRALPRGARADEEPEMAYIPGGCLVVGDREDPDARPMCEVRLRPYWIDLTPVTNGAYLEFVRQTGARRPSSWPGGNRLPKRLERLPVTGVSWQEAKAYAAWAGRRLPSEWEWERAAQGPEHRRYPYGEELDLSRIHTDPRKLAPVGAHPGGASSEGVLDLTGNGWEWTGSAFAPYGASPPARVTARVIRGGYDPARPRSASATFRAPLRPDARDPGVTFRCALDVD
jgi:formylglycine-generating enzyme required for sulfatase activity